MSHRVLLLHIRSLTHRRPYTFHHEEEIWKTGEIVFLLLSNGGGELPTNSTVGAEEGERGREHWPSLSLFFTFTATATPKLPLAQSVSRSLTSLAAATATAAVAAGERWTTT